MSESVAARTKRRDEQISDLTTKVSRAFSAMTRAHAKYQEKLAVYGRLGRELDKLRGIDRRVKAKQKTSALIDSVSRQSKAAAGR